MRRILRDRMREAVDCSTVCSLNNRERGHYAREMADGVVEEIQNTLGGSK